MTAQWPWMRVLIYRRWLCTEIWKSSIWICRRPRSINGWTGWFAICKRYWHFLRMKVCWACYSYENKPLYLLRAYYLSILTPSLGPLKVNEHPGRLLCSSRKYPYNPQEGQRKWTTSGFKKPSLSNEAKCTSFLVKMSFICMRMKNHFVLIKGWALNLVLI